MLLFHLIITGAVAQTISGRIVNVAGERIPGVMVKGIDGETKLVTFAISDTSGRFSISNEGLDRLIFSHLSYQNDTLVITRVDTEWEVVLQWKEHQFDEVVVVNRKLPYRTQGDTTTYRAEGFSDGHERNLEELLQKMPGVKVEDNGNIYFRGKLVSRVLIENDNLFGNRYALGTKSMDPAYVEDFQFIDRYIEEELMKGIANSDELVLNLKLKKKLKLALFGDLEAGAGLPAKHLLKNNLFSLAGQYKGALFSNLNNVNSGNLDLFNYLLGSEEFDQLSYNRSLSTFLFNHTVPVSGLPSERQVIANDGYVSSNNIFNKNAVKAELRITGSTGRNRTGEFRQIRYFQNPDLYTQQYRDSLRHHGLTAFGDLAWKLNAVSKLKIRGQFQIRDDYSGSRQTVSNAADAADFFYTTGADNTSWKGNVEYMLKVSPSALFVANYSSLKDAFAENSANFATGDSITADNLGNFYSQYLRQNLRDQALEFKLLTAGSQHKTAVAIGYQAKNDVISDRLDLYEEAERDSSSFSRTLQEPYLMIQYGLERKNWMWNNRFRNSLAFSPGQANGAGVHLYEISSSLQYKVSRRLSMNLLLRQAVDIRPAILNANISYFSSFKTLINPSTDYSKSKNTFGLLKLAYSNPSQLLELNGSAYYGLRMIPLSSTRISSFNNTVTYGDLTSQPSANFNITFDKFLPPLNSNLSLYAGYNWTRNPLSYQGFDRMTSTAKDFSLKFSTKKLSFIALYLTGNLIMSRIRSSGVSEQTEVRYATFISATAGLKAYLLKGGRLMLNLDSSTYAPARDFDFGRNNFLDFNLSWKLHQDWDIAVHWKNMLDQQIFRRVMLNTIDSQTINTFVQPSFFYFTCTKRFSL